MSRLNIKGQTKYWDLLFHASFTKFTGPARLFLNNNIFNFQKIFVNFGIFFWWWSLQRGQLNKSPCGCKKNVTKSKKKTPQFHKTWPTALFIKRYTRSIIFVTFWWKLSNSWIYLWKKILELHWRCLQNIVLQNPKKNSPFL